MIDHRKKFDNALSTISGELAELGSTLSRLESDLAVSRNVIKKLWKQLLKVERKAQENDQQSCKECLEISGIPDGVKLDWLEETVCKIFNEIDTPVNAKNIESFHPP